MEKLKVETFGLEIVPDGTIKAVLAQYSSLAVEIEEHASKKRLCLHTAVRGINVWTDVSVIFIPPVSEYPKAAADISTVLEDVMVACVDAKGKVLCISVNGISHPVFSVEFLSAEEMLEVK